MKNKEEVSLLGAKSVPQMLETLRSKIESIKKVTDNPYKTNGDVENFANIKTETKIETLVKCFSVIKGASEYYEKASQELGLKTVPEFNINGGTLEDWKSDIKLRISIIEQDSTLKAFQELEKEMSELLDKEDRKSLVIQKLDRLLNS